MRILAKLFLGLNGAAQFIQFQYVDETHGKMTNLVCMPYCFKKMYTIYGCPGTQGNKRRPTTEISRNAQAQSSLA